MSVGTQAMLSKFKGSLLGVLAGDCLGAPFENDKKVALTILNKYVYKLADKNVKVPYKKYTDDTAMARCVAQSLLDKKSFDETDMAKKFVKEYYAEPFRGYGGNVIDVFAALKATKFKDAFAPSAFQFGGRGSYGNGGSMRVAPVALFTARLSETVCADMARDSALLTHSNPLGYNGAILQCLAVRQALHSQADSILPQEFVQQLVKSMQNLHNPREEDQQQCKEELGGGGFVDKLMKVQELLNRAETDRSRDQVIQDLGNNVTALGSVPTAIYAFLRALQPIEGLETDSEFLRAIMYSISLGGDTDTIASMAAAMAGAYLGSEAVPQWLSRHCEGWETALEHSQLLHAHAYPDPAAQP